MIGVIDYGLGNTQAFINIYKRLNIPVQLVSTRDDLESADRIILPGVGSFDWAIQSLRRAGLNETLDECVMGRRIPVLGVCVGMQIMLASSDEGIETGLGWIAGTVRRFDFKDENRLALPHMGWNDIAVSRPSPLMKNLEEGARFYFLHSYHAVTPEPSSVIATADYGYPFVCAVQAGNCFGIQCHPEKSHGWGIQLLKNFAEISSC